jgi:hypothetical protein
MCVNYTNLNKTRSKDSFSMPSIDYLVDSTTNFRCLSFMNAFFNYNQIKMLPTDKHKTTFIIDQGLYCYKVMPFWLKNTRATYQWMVKKVFQKQLGRDMKAYIDDMMVKEPIGNRSLGGSRGGIFHNDSSEYEAKSNKKLLPAVGRKIFGIQKEVNICCP